jgi:transposase
MALLAAAGAGTVLALRADGWALAYDLDAHAVGLAVAPWLALALSAVTASVGLGARGAGALAVRTRVPLRTAVVVATAWSVALLPLDLLRAVRLIPLGVSGWGLGLRVLLGTRSGIYPPESRERALRMLSEARPDHESEYAAMTRAAGRLGINAETLRGWQRRSEVDAGKRPGVTTEEQAEIRRLKKENAELRRANEILKAASASFAAALDRPTTR